VAILSSDTFDATTVDPKTVGLAGAPVKLVGKNENPLAKTKDINSDNIDDLLVKIMTAELALDSSDTEAVLEGRTFAGDEIEGKDIIRIVQLMCWRSAEPE
jgi:hypothetical protein